MRPAAFEAVECGVERAFADEERGVGGLLDPFDDGVPCRVPNSAP
jgi:hypothetical protein